MIRLGLRLALNSGREALTRLIVTTLAVAAGVALLLGVLAEFHAFQGDSKRVCWECTQGNSLPGALPSRGEAWNYSVDYYQGQTIERLDVAALGPDAPVPPGLSRLPGPGQYLASPALAQLIRTVPRDQLGDRFPGTMAGTIGNAALTGPQELVVYVGYDPATLAKVPGTQWVTAIGTSPGPEVFTAFFRYAFGVGVLAVLFPVLILISTATRLAAARREERFAALRLIGATPGDVSVIASVDSVASALLGAIIGTGVFLAVQPALADATLTGTRYFAPTVTPTIWGYVALLVAVPLASALASLLALGRVRISPLGVSRRTTPPPPSRWRLAPLIVGLILFIVGMPGHQLTKSIGVASYPGLLDRHDRPGHRRAVADHRDGAVVRPGPGGPGVRAACLPSAGRRPEGRVPRGPRAGARGVPRHDRGRDGAAAGLADRHAELYRADNVLLDTFFQIEPTLPRAARGSRPMGLTPQAGAALVSGLRKPRRNHGLPAVLAATGRRPELSRQLHRRGELLGAAPAGRVRAVRARALRRCRSTTSP